RADPAAVPVGFHVSAPESTSRRPGARRRAARGGGARARLRGAVRGDEAEGGETRGVARRGGGPPRGGEPPMGARATLSERGMNLDGNALLASILIGSVGFVSFAYGKKQRRLPQMLVGFALMGFPFFVSSVPWMLAIALALLGALWVMLRLGL